MNILVLGASGGTGQQLILQALALGHTVTAVVRRPKAFTLAYDRLRVVAGDALDTASLADACAGQDVVVSALGVGFRASLKPMRFHVDTARNVVAAMAAHGVRRFIGITSVGVLHDPTAPIWYRTILQPLLRHKYADMRRMEELIAASGLDWTIVRPVRLVDGPLTQVYRVGETGMVKDAGRISRADVADLIARQAAAGAFINSAVALSY